MARDIDTEGLKHIKSSLGMIGMALESHIADAKYRGDWANVRDLETAKSEVDCAKEDVDRVLERPDDGAP